jgi:SnoaL-like domain
MQTIKQRIISTSLVLITVALSMQLSIAQEGTKVAMLPQKPEDWPGVFEKHLNAGDLDAVMTLYEPEAHFVAKSGEILIGHDAIRKALDGLIEAKTQFHSRVVRATIVCDIAQVIHRL